MPFDHNDHYHRLLLRQVPRSCTAALDVGCGTGRFAQRLAALGIEVDAIDPAPEVIAQARAHAERSGGAHAPRFRRASATDIELPHGHYDFVSCLASLHHMPFDTVAALRDALAPGGVLAVLGCYAERGWRDWTWGLAAAPTNAVARLAVATGDRLRPAAAARRARPAPPVRQPTMLLPEIRQQAAALLPGCHIRRLLFWRYLLVFCKDS
ncbi:class I SAM-dependent methyltransferase [Streptomyces noursei]|uniref:class I SAM-dependent methyltransferase n=1 Tax=Streptomyces noursei TaxID=1971 RepID=UPI001671D835|nr:class I SAM-dependent methyltransferase [Streptomyces noursei]MCZ1019141.1 class I SAM-dependent methyltransferase [Streptomyces noursei]GGX47016.1 methyltransferase [Streptomyces noursei]